MLQKHAAAGAQLVAVYTCSGVCVARAVAEQATNDTMIECFVAGIHRSCHLPDGLKKCALAEQKILDSSALLSYNHKLQLRHLDL